MLTGLTLGSGGGELVLETAKALLHPVELTAGHQGRDETDGQDRP